MFWLRQASHRGPKTYGKSPKVCWKIKEAKTTTLSPLIKPSQIQESAPISSTYNLQFNIQFTPQPPKQDKSARQTKCKFKAITNVFDCEIRPADVTAAIKKIKKLESHGTGRYLSRDAQTHWNKGHRIPNKTTKLVNSNPDNSTILENSKNSPYSQTWQKPRCRRILQANLPPLTIC